MSEVNDARTALTQGDGYFLLENLIDTDTAARIRSILLDKFINV